MTIRTSELDDQALAYLMGQIGCILRKTEPSDDERRAIAAEQARQQSIQASTAANLSGHVGVGLFAAFGGMVVVATATAGMLVLGGYMAQYAWLPATLGGIAGGVGGGWAGWRASRRSKELARDADRVQRDLLARWIPLVSLPRLEQIYWDAVQVLANDSAGVRDASGHAILQHLNALLAHGREIESRRQSILSVVRSEDSRRIMSERAELSERVLSASDPIARQALEQSLRMCDERIENVGKLKPALERLDAQQEAILQTMASIQSSLARWQVAPAAHGEPDLEEIRQSVVRINDETHAVEQAVQEVITLS